MNSKVNKLLFLAPEIPALSATFVYNEILNLEKRGVEVVPVSIHTPKSPAKEPEAENLSKRTQYLYEKSLWTVGKLNFMRALKNPFCYSRTLFMVLSDALKCGVFSRIGMGLFYRFLYASVLANIIQKENCSHLHCHFAHVSTDIVMYASCLSNIPFSFTSHANDIFDRHWLLREKIKRSQFAITISEFNKNYLLNFGADPAKVHVVHCGVNPSVFGNPSPCPENVVLKIGSLGRLVEKKGFDVLIEACKKIKEKNISFKLEIAGDGPLKRDYLNQVEKLGLESQVSFIGSLSHDAVPEWLKSLDAFALACRKDKNNDMDGIPVVLMEAMMSNVPVVSTRLSGIPELVKDGKTGYLAEPDDPDSLANAIYTVLKEPSSRDRLCGDAIKHIKKKFNLLKNTDCLLKHFERVTS